MHGKRVSKLAILNRIYALLSTSMDIGHAQVATLGGEGLEADLWGEVGIQKSGGWLVDLSPGRIKNLLKQFQGYRIHQGQLSGFPDIFVGSTRFGLDLFHLDVCGTIDRFTDELVQILPLLMKGKAKILAITVSDARLSRAVLDPEALKREVRQLFGAKNADHLLKNLELLHDNLSSQVVTKADPTQALLRELATMVVVFRGIAGLPTCSKYLPKLVQRYIYYSGHRMRTYIFQFEAVPSPISAEVLAERFAEILLLAPCWWVSRGNFTEIRLPRIQPRLQPPAPASVMADKKEETMTTKRNLDPELTATIDRLRALIAGGALGPAPVKDIKAVIARCEAAGKVVDPEFVRSQRKQVLKEFMGALEQSMAEFRKNVGKEETTIPKPPRVRKHRDHQSENGRMIKYNEALANDHFRLDMLCIRADHPEEEKAYVEKFRQAKGMAIGKKLIHAVAARMAWATPKSSPKMIRRLIDEAKEKKENLDVLAELLARVIPLPLAKVRQHGGLKALPK